MSQIQQESAYRNFIESLPSPVSKIVYRNNLKLYARYRNAEIEKLLEGDPRLLQSQIIDYIICLKNAGLSSNSINTRINSIKKLRKVHLERKSMMLWNPMVLESSSKPCL